MKKVVTVSALLLLFTLSLGGGVASKSNESAATYENLKLFTEVLDIIQKQYVDEVPAKDLVYSAVKGTLRGLDPHSSFLDPEMYKEMQVETSGSFGGLGIEITLKDDVLTVVTPIEGTPAYRAGIHPGDRIVKIEGLTTKDMQLTDAVKRMRGKPGTKVTISVVREVDQVRTSRSPRADPRAVREDSAARAGHRIHPPAPVPGANLRRPRHGAGEIFQGR
jgi:carboxyl-terminal processing protease